MGNVIVLIVVVVAILVVGSFVLSMASAAARGRRQAQEAMDRLALYDQQQEAKSIEERIAEAGLSDVAKRHPEAARQVVMTPAEREAEEREQRASH